jgi:3-dehydroquinate synthase
MQPIFANNYSIYFNEKGYESLNKFISENNYSSLYLLVDTLSNKYCFDYFIPFLATNLKIEVIEFENGEANKNIETCVEIWKVLTEYEADRKSLLLNLGGGVVTDLGGFVASTYKRGVDFINIPTTLLAMVDASIGGKNGVDLGNLKNQIGVINNPKMVLIDTNFLDTMPINEMKSGLAEMIKHGLIANKIYFEKFLNLSSLDNSVLDDLIYESIVIKNSIVMQDPTENGIRKALNFGHTLGHAIESYFLETENKKTLLHGEAIAIGMILESYISKEKGLLSESEYKQIKSLLKNLFDTIEINGNDIKLILEFLIHDKKNEYGKIQFALLNGIGNIKINQFADNDMIIRSFEDYKRI